MTRPERLERLLTLIRGDPRMREVEITSRPRQLAIYFGGFRGWKHVADRRQLDGGDLREYADTIIHRWERRGND